ncbi:MAG: hypothetical protein ACJAVH_001996 [Bacteroidia bacterium]|jgi:hypothetical protein
MQSKFLFFTVLLCISFFDGTCSSSVDSSTVKKNMVLTVNQSIVGHSSFLFGLGKSFSNKVSISLSAGYSNELYYHSTDRRYLYVRVNQSPKYGNAGLIQFNISKSKFLPRTSIFKWYFGGVVSIKRSFARSAVQIERNNNRFWVSDATTSIADLGSELGISFEVAKNLSFGLGFSFLIHKSYLSSEVKSTIQEFIVEYSGPTIGEEFKDNLLGASFNLRTKLVYAL